MKFLNQIRALRSGWVFNVTVFKVVLDDKPMTGKTSTQERSRSWSIFIPSRSVSIAFSKDSRTSALN